MERSDEKKPMLAILIKADLRHADTLRVVFVRFVLRVDVAAEIGHQLIEVAVWLQHVVVAVWLFRRESAFG